MNYSPKKNHEQHLPPLPSIESSFPAFELNYPRNINDFFNVQNDASIKQSPHLSFIKSDESEKNDNNIRGRTLFPNQNYPKDFSHQNQNENEISNTNLHVPHLIINQSSLNSNQQSFIQPSNNITKENSNFGLDYHQTECKNNAYFKPPFTNQLINTDNAHSDNTLRANNGNDSKTNHTIAIFPADKKKYNGVNDSNVLQNFSNNSFDTKAEPDSSNNSPSTSSLAYALTDTDSVNDTDSVTDISKKSSSKMSIKTNLQEITIDPNKLGFLPRDYWIQSGILTLDDLKRDFFRARSSKSLRFEFKLWNALAITKRYPSLFMEIGVKWVAHVLIMVHRDVFGKLLNVSRPSAALFSSCGAFMTHGFVELSLREAKQKLYMMSLSIQSPNNKNNIDMSNIVYQNRNNLNSQMNVYYNGPNIYSNVIPVFQGQLPGINCQQQVQQVQQVPLIQNIISNELIPPFCSYRNHQTEPFVGPNLIDSSGRLADPPTDFDVDFDLPSEIDESIVRLFIHKTGEFTEESHANEISKCKWSNESRSQIKNFKI